jgi:hypothetical protein
MRLCVFEDQGVSRLEPLTLTRPAFDLWCGAASLVERQGRYFAASVTHALVRPELVDVARHSYAPLRVNDANWTGSGPTVLVNARWLPPAGTFAEPSRPRVGVVDSQVAYVVLPAGEKGACPWESLESRVSKWKETLEPAPAGGAMIDFPWNLVAHNEDMLKRDVPAGADQERFCRPSQVVVLGPADRLFVDQSAQVDPLVLADTTAGPVIIDREARVKRSEAEGDQLHSRRGLPRRRDETWTDCPG